jgi:cytochrome c biogenesis protein CcdA
VELIVTVGKVRRLLNEALGDTARRGRTPRLMDLTIAVALGAGLLSFLSPCVLPLVPAYIGQLSAVAVVGRADGAPSRWLAVRHALAYVAGFGRSSRSSASPRPTPPGPCTPTWRRCASSVACCSSCSG